MASSGEPGRAWSGDATKKSGFQVSFSPIELYWFCYIMMFDRRDIIQALYFLIREKKDLTITFIRKCSRNICDLLRWYISNLMKILVT